MVFKQGNTYQLQVQINDIDVEDIAKIVFVFNSVKKTWTAGGQNTEVEYQSDGTFVVYLTQADTLSLKGKVQYEVAIKFTDDSVKRSIVNSTSSLITMIEEVI